MSHPNPSMTKPCSASILPQTGDIRLHTHSVLVSYEFKKLRSYICSVSCSFLHSDTTRNNKQEGEEGSPFSPLFSKPTFTEIQCLATWISRVLFLRPVDILKRHIIDGSPVHNFENHTTFTILWAGVRKGASSFKPWGKMFKTSFSFSISKAGLICQQSPHTLNRRWEVRVLSP